MAQEEADDDSTDVELPEGTTLDDILFGDATLSDRTTAVTDGGVSNTDGRSEFDEEDRQMTAGSTSSPFRRMLDSLPTQTSGEVLKCPKCGWSPDDGEKYETVFGLSTLPVCSRCGAGWRDDR